MLRNIARPSAARYVRTALQAIRSETDLQSQLKQNQSCVVGFFEDERESSRIAKSDLNTVSDEFANIPFFAVNGTQCPQLLRNHEIRRMPAIVTFRDGDVLECSADLDKNTMRETISKLPNAKRVQGGGLLSSLFGGQQEKQQEKQLEQRVEDAHDKNARKEWETSPEEAVHKKHPLREPDTDVDSRPGLNKLASGLKEGYDEAMDDVARRAKKQRNQHASSNAGSTSSDRKQRSADRSDLNNSGKQRSKDRSRNLNEDESSGRTSPQAANRDNENVSDTIRRDRNSDSKRNQQLKRDQRSNNSETIQGSNQSRDDTAESRHGELETAKRSIKSGSGNLDMPQPNDADAKQSDPTKRAASNDRRQSSTKSKTPNAQSTL